ncbi:MAG TPA: hypothetical protein VHO70_23905 [Chitinispirillaceae bacterium]|nr:hypothetical protein [Chitinispirillaceae bacterium]
MLKRYKNSFLCVCSVLVLFTTDASAKVKLKKLLIASQLQSWVEQKEISRKFTSKGLFEIINGGAVDYVNQGLIEGIHQQFSNKDGRIVEVFVEDFGTGEKASSMFETKKSGCSNVATLQGLSGFNHFVENAIGASVVIVSFDNIYLEMTVSGCKDSSQVESVALEFLNYYKFFMK